MELDGETVNVDLRGKDMDGKGEGCSSGISDLVLAEGETSCRNKKWAWEDLEISVCECGNEGEDKSRGDPQSGFDLWTVGELSGFCGVEDGVLIDVFKVLGASAVGHAVGLIFEDEAVQKITQITY